MLTVRFFPNHYNLATTTIYCAYTYVHNILVLCIALYHIVSRLTNEGVGMLADGSKTIFVEFGKIICHSRATHMCVCSNEWCFRCTCGLFRLKHNVNRIKKNYTFANAINVRIVTRSKVQTRRYTTYTLHVIILFTRNNCNYILYIIIIVSENCALKSIAHEPYLCDIHIKLFILIIGNYGHWHFVRALLFVEKHTCVSGARIHH